MPPRYTYWTIIVGGQSTAFRAATRDELLPTLKQLQSKQPDAVMMWFARGKLWPSEEAAAMALRMERQGPGRERRGPQWRPGGEHQDPRDRFKVPRDVKRQRFATRMRRDRIGEQAPRGEGQGDRPSRPREERPRPDRPVRPAGERTGGDRPFRPREERPAGGRASPPKDGPPGDRPSRPKGPSGPGKPGGGGRGGGTKGGGGGRGRGPR